MISIHRALCNVICEMMEAGREPSVLAIGEAMLWSSGLMSIMRRDDRGNLYLMGIRVEDISQESIMLFYGTPTREEVEYEISGATVVDSVMLDGVLQLVNLED